MIKERESDPNDFSMQAGLVNVKNYFSILLGTRGSIEKKIDELCKLAKEAPHVLTPETFRLLASGVIDSNKCDESKITRFHPFYREVRKTTHLKD